MATRRMFSKEVIDTDLFLSLSRGAQNLYFHLALRADDDGFVNNPLRLQKMLDGQDSEMEELIKKEFILLFESGVIVIKHWKVHNYIKTDRYKETICKEEKKLLALDENKAYIIVEPDWNRNGTKMEPQVRLESGKDSLGEDSSCQAKFNRKNNKSNIKESKYDFDALEKIALDNITNGIKVC